MIEQFVGEQEARVLRASPLGAHLDVFAAGVRLVVET